jgi:hypothetical protein
MKGKRKEQTVLKSIWWKNTGRRIRNHLSIIILNINSLNSLIKRYGLTDWIKK